MFARFREVVSLDTHDTPQPTAVPHDSHALDVGTVHPGQQDPQLLLVIHVGPSQRLAQLRHCLCAREHVASTKRQTSRRVKDRQDELRIYAIPWASLRLQPLDPRPQIRQLREHRG